MIDKTTLIDKTAQIAENVEIGAFTAIGKNVIIKAGAKIGANCFIEYSEIGENCRIFHSASVGTEPQDLSYKDKETKVFIGAGTVLREFVTINRGNKTDSTIIGKNCYFMACSHAAHDTRVGDNVIIANCSSLGGHVEVGEGAFISGNVGVHQWTRLGKGTMTGSNSMVGMDIIPYAACSGQRAVLEGLNLVGMKRRKMTQEQISQIKEAYKILFMSKLLLKDAVAQLETYQSAEIKEILEFIKNSKRSIARP